MIHTVVYRMISRWNDVYGKVFWTCPSIHSWPNENLGERSVNDYAMDYLGGMLCAHPGSLLMGRTEYQVEHFQIADRHAWPVQSHPIAAVPVDARGGLVDSGRPWGPGGH